ncbi:unnamed protein product [Ceratitis capitata]|uniref:(Mediterranean fruit fly) hypothetical protein n=1 Tax=Ceratitis capitata TaxID=7213 RepID=A0A811V8W0_CERCA|nr:unnamed protein product [Ceratitis capitata]
MCVSALVYMVCAFHSKYQLGLGHLSLMCGKVMHISHLPQTTTATATGAADARCHATIFKCMDVFARERKYVCALSRRMSAYHYYTYIYLFIYLLRLFSCLHSQFVAATCLVNWIVHKYSLIYAANEQRCVASNQSTSRANN